MPVTDLSIVTQTIANMIKSVTGVMPGFEPPDNLPEGGITFYLYHVEENAAFKNLPSSATSLEVQAKDVPMALNLYYILTAKGDLDPKALQEQVAMSAAMKALHDNPDVVLPDPPGGKGDKVKISILPISNSEAIHYWTAGQTPLRLSAYYQVGAVLLQPETPTTNPGRVLTYGTYVFPMGAPRIYAIQNTISFKPPGSAPQQIVSQPAQATYGDTFEVIGDGFEGEQIQLQITTSGWATPVVLSLNTPTWNLTISAENQLSATVQQNAPDGTGIAALPGVYAAQVTVANSIILANGDVRQMRNLSNQFPFSICPLITSATVAGNLITITGSDYSAPSIDSIQIFLGNAVFVNSTLLPGCGSFKIVGTKIQMDKTGLAISGTLPLRVIVQGAESHPSWITV